MHIEKGSTNSHICVIYYYYTHQHILHTLLGGQNDVFATLCLYVAPCFTILVPLDATRYGKKEFWDTNKL